ncbi:MAG: hypothetical protein C0446_08290 [Chitinophaga sp.]|nr:hypothetical protein [Chitinophaga sp.]
MIKLIKRLNGGGGGKAPTPTPTPAPEPVKVEEPKTPATDPERLAQLERQKKLRSQAGTTTGESESVGSAEDVTATTTLLGNST